MRDVRQTEGCECLVYVAVAMRQTDRLDRGYEQPEANTQHHLAQKFG